MTCFCVRAVLLLVVFLLPCAAVRAQYNSPNVQCEDTCNHIHGIDLSHYQGDVFWETVGRNKKINYVYLKATEGATNIDERYERNLAMAKRNGLYAGSYHYFRPQTPLAGQMANFTAQCIPQEQDLIPMIDVETTGGLSEADFIDSLVCFLSLVEDYYHVKPLVYSGARFYNRHLSFGLLDDYKLMIAQYTDYAPVLADERSYTIWQYTGKGSVAGVRGNIDKSRLTEGHTLRDIKYTRR